MVVRTHLEPLMRNPNRIPVLLSMLGHIWVKTPDQRLGQLIVNITRDNYGNIRDPWKIEDDQIFNIMYNELLNYYGLREINKIMGI